MSGLQGEDVRVLVDVAGLFHEIVGDALQFLVAGGSRKELRSAGRGCPARFGVKAVSVPIRDHTGDVVAALSLSGLTAHLPDSELEAQLQMLRTASAEASRAMGLRDGG